MTQGPGPTPSNLHWLLRLRWCAILGQAVVIAVVHFGMALPLPLGPLGVVLAAESVSNLVLWGFRRRAADVSETLLFLAMAFDVVALTALLFFTGGPFNPFSFLYLVHIALAAVVLAPRWTWSLVGLSAACFGGLFLHHVFLPLDTSDPSQHAVHMLMHLRGMWVAFLVAAGFIVYFVQRVRRTLKERDLELTQARAHSARSEKLAALATLAAGAAHELSTPLSTIAVVAKELERVLQASSPPSVLADVRLVREQVERCRDILGQMRADAGQDAGEPLSQVAVGELVAEAVSGLSASVAMAARVSSEVASVPLTVPRRAVAAALRGVVQNAAQASAPGGTVEVEATLEEATCRLRVTDHGAGMSAEVLAHAGEPFFTTKAPGQGMGLGLFLARTVLERLGGRLALRSEPGLGSTVELLLPRSPLTAPAKAAVPP